MIVTFFKISFNLKKYKLFYITPFCIMLFISGRFVLGVTAVDKDVGTNGEISYFMFGADASSFEINENTGVMTAKRTIGSSQRGYSFHVRATDKVRYCYQQRHLQLN